MLTNFPSLTSAVERGSPRVRHSSQPLKLKLCSFSSGCLLRMLQAPDLTLVVVGKFQCDFCVSGSRQRISSIVPSQRECLGSPPGWLCCSRRDAPKPPLTLTQQLVPEGTQRGRVAA